jgi:opacity protein-like surface antigen
MKSHKAIIGLFILPLLLVVFPNQSTAQWSIGASYEIRDVEPENGFGAHIERDILQGLPIIDLGLRAHFSYFSAENEVTEQQLSYSTKIENYDYGVAALGGFSLGLISPYAGLGLGSTNASFSIEGIDLPEEESESGIYWNGFVGAKVSPIPMLKPFVEYRIKSEEEFENLQNNINTDTGRLIFGVSISL